MKPLITSLPAYPTLLLVLFMTMGAVLPAAGAQPAEELWTKFMGWNPGSSRLPEDEEMGVLADRRRPDGVWAAALAVCDDAFAALSNGTVDTDLLAPSFRTPLGRSLEAALGSGALEAQVRYGRPERNGDRLDVPVRLAFGENVEYGNLYLVRIGGAWLIEQWALNLVPFATGRPAPGSMPDDG